MKNDETPTQSYRSRFLRALIEAAGGEVKILNGSSESSQRHADMWYRDAVFVIPEQKIILTTSKADSARQITQQNITQEIISRDESFRALETNAYFEGGNLFYLSDQKTLLHGDHAEGHYKNDFSEYCPSKQTKKMREDLEIEGISILGLTLSAEALTAKEPLNPQMGSFRAYYAYHLDCFMQTMPDGRVLLINSKILSQQSLEALQGLLGDKLVDLAYESYITKPVLLNFLTIPFEDSFRIVSDTLPHEILTKLRALGYSLITPEMFLPVRSEFHEGFNKSVIRNMREAGYQGVYSDISLLCDPEAMSHLDENPTLSALMGSVPECNLFNPMGHGGLHCLVLDIYELGKKNLNHVNCDDLSITEATSGRISPEDWKVIIEANPMEPLTRLQLYMRLLQSGADKNYRVSVLDSYFSVAVKLQTRLYDIHNEHPLSMFSINDIIRSCPDLIQEIDQFVKDHLSEIFFYTPLNNELDFSVFDRLKPEFDNLELEKLLPNITSIERLRKVGKFIFPRYPVLYSQTQCQEAYRLLEQYVSENLKTMIKCKRDRTMLLQDFPSLANAIWALEISERPQGKSGLAIGDGYATLCIERALELIDNRQPITRLQHAESLPSVATLLYQHGILHRKGMSVERRQQDHDENSNVNLSQRMPPK